MFRSVARSAAAAAVALAFCLGSAPADARTLDEILSSKKVVVGINPGLPPLGMYNEKNEMDGFDVELAQRFAQMLGVTLEMVKVGPNDRIPFLTSGKIDFVLGAMTRTPERAKVIDFTLPIYTEVLGVLTTKDKPYKHWKDLDDPNVRMVAVRGTTPVAFIQKNLPKAQLQLIDDHPEIVTLIAQKRADASISVVDTLGIHMQKFNADWKILDTTVETYYNPAGVAKGNFSLRDWLNVAIFELHRTGWIDDTWRKWFKLDMLKPVNPSPYF